MKLFSGVISGSGVPTVASFPVTSSGTPLYINLATGYAYFINAANAVQQISVAGGGGDMLKSENLSGLANYTTARSNLGLGSAATTAATAYATAAQGSLARTFAMMGC